MQYAVMITFTIIIVSLHVYDAFGVLVQDLKTSQRRVAKSQWQMGCSGFEEHTLPSTDKLSQ